MTETDKAQTVTKRHKATTKHRQNKKDSDKDKKDKYNKKQKKRRQRKKNSDKDKKDKLEKYVPLLLHISLPWSCLDAIDY